MLNITFDRTQTERTGDSNRPFQFNRTEEHRERVEAHCKRVREEYFDSGLQVEERIGEILGFFIPAELIDD